MMALNLVKKATSCNANEQGARVVNISKKKQQNNEKKKCTRIVAKKLTPSGS